MHAACIMHELQTYAIGRNNKINIISTLKTIRGLNSVEEGRIYTITPEKCRHHQVAIAAIQSLTSVPLVPKR